MREGGSRAEPHLRSPVIVHPLWELVIIEDWILCLFLFRLMGTLIYWARHKYPMGIHLHTQGKRTLTSKMRHHYHDRTAWQSDINSLPAMVVRPVPPVWCSCPTAGVKRIRCVTKSTSQDIRWHLNHTEMDGSNRQEFCREKML